MFLSFQQVASTNAVQNSTALTIPGKATGVELQADTNNIRFTMDNTTDPSSSSGMLLLTTEPPRAFGIDDLRRIRFIQNAVGAGKLNIHYFAGRDI